MSCIVLQIGQCGNQIGQHFWPLVDYSLDLQDADDNCFVLTNQVNEHLYYRSINIDTETKVIDNLSNGKSLNLKCTFRPSNMVTEKCGRGNNWAMGYYQGRLSHRDDIFERTMQEMRREVERGGTYKGCLMFHSISGGTGSGVSSKLGELIRDEYEKEFLISMAVTPFKNGDTPLQDYNSLLTLSKLHFQCDVVMLFSNDQVMRKFNYEQMSQRHSNNGCKKQSPISFNDLNKVIASNIAGLLLPTNVENDTHNTKTPAESVAKMFNKDNCNKFVSCNYISQQFNNWDSALETLLNQLPTFNKVDNFEQMDPQHFKDVINLKKLLVVNRGTLLLNKEPLKIPFINRKIKEYFSLKRNINSTSLWYSKEPINSITIAFQSDLNKIYLERILRNSLEKFVVGAYVHWYEKHGATVDDFHGAFKYIQNILSYM